MKQHKWSWPIGLSFLVAATVSGSAHAGGVASVENGKVKFASAPNGVEGECLEGVFLKKAGEKCWNAVEGKAVALTWVAPDKLGNGKKVVALYNAEKRISGADELKVAFNTLSPGQLKSVVLVLNDESTPTKVSRLTRKVSVKIEEDGRVLLGDDHKAVHNDCWKDGALTRGGECIDEVNDSVVMLGSDARVGDSEGKPVVLAKIQNKDKTWIINHVYAQQACDAKSHEKCLGQTDALVVAKLVGSSSWQLLRTADLRRAPNVGDAQSSTNPPPPWGPYDCLEGVDTEAPGEYVCVDLAAGTSVVRAPSANIIAPNESLVLVVRHPSGEIVVANMGGEQGLTIPSVPKDDKTAQAENDPPEPKPTYATSIFRFAPRKSGSANIAIKTHTGDPSKLTERLTVEIEVDQRFWAAARTGIATVFGDYKGYEVITFEGSQQPQINERSVPVQFEAVLGFALYPEAFGGCGGRSYTEGCNSHVAPYLGFGVVGQTYKSVSAFTSFHVGLDIEFTRNISLAVTAVARRHQYLVEGYTVGSPVSAGSEAFLENGFAFGGGLVLNGTPDFLRFEQ